MAESTNSGTRYQCPYCSEEYFDFNSLKDHVIKNHPNEQVEKPEGLISLTINGDDYEIQVEAEWTLQRLIHDELGLTSVKLFCDHGACGSCAVIMDGRPILSCMTLAIECDGTRIETAEGVAKMEHPLVDLYVKHHAMQCGYCTPGFVVTAKALLDKNPEPTTEEIENSLAGNLCRCGTYPQHVKAIREAVIAKHGTGAVR